jgi:hypothetical protein
VNDPPAVRGKRGMKRKAASDMLTWLQANCGRRVSGAIAR